MGRLCKMNSCVVALFISALFVVACADHNVSPDIKTELRNAIVECQKEYDVTNERYRSFFKSDATPENEKEKCFVACTYKKLGVVTDGVFDTVKLKSDNRRKYNNEEDIKNADAVVDACAASLPKQIQNECDYAVEVTKCIMNESKKYKWGRQWSSKK